MEKYNIFNGFLYEKISRFSDIYPEKTALTNGMDSAAYVDLKRIYDSARRFFLENEIEPWRRVAFFIKDSVTFAAIQLPFLENAVIAHIDNALSEERIIYMTELLHHDYIVTDAPTDKINKIIKTTGLGLICVEKTGAMGNMDVALELVAKPSFSDDHRELKKESHALICTTSGTTSEPKVVPTDCRTVVMGIERNINAFDTSQADIILDMTLLTRNIGINSVIMAVTTGSTAISTNGFNHSKCIDLFSRYDITIFTAPPVVLESLLDYLALNKQHLQTSKLRFVRTMGAALNEKLRMRIEREFGTDVVQAYGMTETKMIACTRKAPYGFRENSVGVVTGLDVKIENNEIMVRGNTVFEGYENGSIDNSEYFTDGWFHTGDTGEFDEDGYLFITGRIKEMINRGGEKVSPYEVEKALLSIDGVREAVVFPYPNEYGSEEVGAVIVEEGGKGFTLNAIRLLLSGRIMAFKMPTLLFVTTKIPVGENGKIQRKTLYRHLSKAGFNKESKDMDSSNAFTPFKNVIKRIKGKFGKIN